MTATLITNVSIFDGSGAPLFPGEVPIEGERIKTVAKRERIAAPRAEVVDGKGGTLMPGFIEPHAHLTFTCAVDRIVPTFMPPVEDHVFFTAHNTKTMLDYGYTSAFSGGATRPQIEVTLRAEIANRQALKLVEQALLNFHLIPAMPDDSKLLNESFLPPR